jgi:hypothetical protein
MVGSQSTQVDKIAKVFLIYLLVVRFTADEPKAMGRDERIPAASETLENVPR